MSITLNLGTVTHSSSISVNGHAEFKQVTFNLINQFKNLSHLVIYDYQRWLACNGDQALLVLDSSSDNMNVANGRFDRAVQGSELYLLQAYFDFKDIAPIIMHIPNTASELHLTIEEKDDLPSFFTRLPARFITEEEAAKAFETLNTLSKT